jgi:PKD repeat protein
MNKTFTLMQAKPQQNTINSLISGILLKFRLVLITTFMLPAFVSAQCPVANSCTPGTASNPNAGVFGGGILRVSIGAINNITGGALQGYQDYCNVGTAIISLGNPTAITVQTGNNVNENVRVWLDLDNNGTFDAVNELVFSSNNAKIHTGNITITSSNHLNTPLRLRVSSDAIVAALPTPCSTPEYGQVEDYSVRLTALELPPVARFNSPDSITCSGQVRFFDNSSNLPNAWNWSFGDGNTSTLQNPVHNYTSSGVYTVKLKVTNNFGVDSITKFNYIKYNDTVPAAATCTPQTLNQCCGYGITNFTFNTINRNSGLGQYENATCGFYTVLKQGINYPVSLITNASQTQDTRIWIDYNDNGAFEGDELVFSSDATINPAGFIRIKDSAIVLNKALRLRVLSDFSGASLNPCGPITHGQAEDYTVFILPNTDAPIAGFTAINITDFCSNSFRLESTSQNIISTYRWIVGDFLDSTTTTPSITFNAPALGVFDATLIVTGPFGSDTLTKLSSVINAGPVLPSCALNTQQGPAAPLGIARVVFNTINKRSGSIAEGYQNFTCTDRTVVKKGNSYQLRVSNSSVNRENVRAWIDYNRDGEFSQNEEVMNSQNDTLHVALVNIAGSAVINQALRMRVASIRQQAQINSPCGTISFGQAEDYSIVVVDNFEKPIANFSAFDTVNCTGVVQFVNISLNSPTSFFWDFGDGNTSTLENPIHSYSNAGVFTVKLKVSNQFGVDSITKVNYVNVTAATGMLPIACKPAAIQTINGIGIRRVEFANINNTSAAAPVKYQDFTCDTIGRVSLGSTYPITIQTGANNVEWVRVWIDFNNNGVFESTEIVFTSPSAAVDHNGNITIPDNAIVNTGLRMRVYSEFGSPASAACNNPQFGQVEDYQIIVTPAAAPPIANFTASDTNTCYTSIQFTNLSGNAPTSFLWNFGDGNTSTLRNPTHNYSGSGSYTVKLIVSNSFGTDSITKTNFINITNAEGLKPPPCKPFTLNATPNSNPGLGVQLVVFASINHATQPFDFGYKDFACEQQTTLTLGASYPIQVRTSPNINENVRVWIDYNNNGTFEANELVFTSNNARIHNGIITIPISAVSNTPLRMRVMSENSNSPTVLAPCSDLLFGQVEDYAVKLLPFTQAPVTNFGVVLNATTTCNGFVAFVDSTQNFPNSWFWDFGDGNTSTLQNPTHTYTATGLYTVKLVTSNVNGVDSLTKTNYINVTSLLGPLPPNCIPQTQIPNNVFGITRVQFAGIDRTSQLSIVGTEDFTCSDMATTSPGQSPTITVNTSTGTERERVIVWIDFNNNGILENNATERFLLNTTNGQVHTRNIPIPLNATLGKGLRMRLISEPVGTPVNSPCANPNRGQTEDYTLMVNDPTSNIEVLQKDKFKVYPNPATAVLNIKSPAGLTQKPYTVEVFNTVGKLVFKTSMNDDQSIDLTSLTTGVYMVKISASGMTEYHKIIKN